MRRWKAPEGFVVPKTKSDAEQRILLTCRFISPVFGGGVEPRQYDEVTPVRVPAIRGQLRTWWRATHADLDLNALRKLEAQVFGGVHGKVLPSAVSLHVVQQPRPPKRLDVFKQGDAFKLTDDKLRNLAYGAFPLRGTASTPHAPLWVFDGPFQLEISFPTKWKDEVERALWAWLHFGGLGGRTRRGFGAIELVDGNWKLPSIKEGWPKAPHQKRKWPTLRKPGDVHTSPGDFSTGQQAQERLLGVLLQMRQGPGMGRNRGNQRNRPGRSLWPEPDTLRRIHGVGSHRHTEPMHDPRIEKFPRAAFGAPVIFHFKTERGEREPRDSTLVPVVGEKVMNRLASSLILRPHANGQGRFEAMAVHLDHQSPSGWRIKERNASCSATLTEDEAARIVPLQVNNQAFADPIDAFFARLKAR